MLNQVVDVPGSLELEADLVQHVTSVEARRLPVFEAGGKAMLYWAAVFFIIALVAAIFGFGGIATGAAMIAKILFFVFLVIFLVALIAGLSGRGRHHHA